MKFDRVDRMIDRRKLMENLFHWLMLDPEDRTTSHYPLNEQEIELFFTLLLTRVDSRK